jgi:hypothetical protein
VAQLLHGLLTHPSTRAALAEKGIAHRELHFKLHIPLDNCKIVGTELFSLATQSRVFLVGLSRLDELNNQASYEGKCGEPLGLCHFAFHVLPIETDLPNDAEQHYYEPWVSYCKVPTTENHYILG